MFKRAALLSLCCALGFAGIASSWQSSATKPRLKTSRKTIEFDRDVRPILSAHCWVCHGADKAALERTGNMRLDSFEGATELRGDHRAIVPGRPDQSRLIQRIDADEDTRMPPVWAPVKPLTDAEKKTLRQWVLEGAEYKPHWAFVAPIMPQVPKVSDASWGRNPIDGFIYERLESQGLRPEPEADKPTLIRRATLALTGLPPTTQEVRAFLSDKRPEAYEKLIDRLLASPHYGENQARYWLDAVRYADTHGLHIDNERAVYPYRDWVVRAFNEDLPFDKFTVWQLAGDLLPNPSLEQKIATGYVRMNPTTAEGGVIEAEFLAKNTFDRVDTTSTVFLAATLGCAKCHDHKYDPFSQRDYYSMYAFFDSTVDTPLDGNLKLHAPYIKAPTPEEDRTLKSWESELRKMEDAAGVEAAGTWALANAPEMPAVGKWELSQAFEAKDFDAAHITNFGPEPGGDASKAIWKPLELVLDQPKGDLLNKDNAAAYLRTTLSVKDAVSTALRLGSDDGIKVWLNGKLVHDNKVLRALAADQDTVKISLQSGENSLLIKVVDAGGGDGVFVGLGDAAAKRLGRIHELAVKGGLATDEKRELLSGFLELGPESPAAKSYRKVLANYRKLDALIPMSYVAEEMKEPRPTFILKRGAYDHPGDPVERAIPRTFGTMPAYYPKNRLGLARWLTDPKNPLVARVFVNRVWQQQFGTGIVKSSEDFGVRGDWPTHPGLLDYLAVRFVKDGWSLKKLQKLILTSETFKQSSACSAQKLAKDLDNLLLSRGPRFRLDAEVIRDSALSMSGMLVDKAGGHGDKPYQPPGLWEIIAYPISDTARYFQDHGDALYRRSLYLFWKRTSPPPTMMLFDAPMRESCVVRRSRTNTPTQALATMNETGSFEAARGLAARVMIAKKSDPDRLFYAFRLATSREPSEREQTIMLRFLADERKAYQANPQSAMDALSVGESPRNTNLPLIDHAAWLLVCNLILNLDETLTQH